MSNSYHRKNVRRDPADIICQHYWDDARDLLELIPECRTTGRACMYAQNQHLNTDGPNLWYMVARRKFFATMQWLADLYKAATGFYPPHDDREEFDFYLRLIDDEAYRLRLLTCINQHQETGAPPQDLPFIQV